MSSPPAVTDTPRMQLHPGRALGFFVLGASLHDILTQLKSQPKRYPELDLTYSPTDPVRDPVILALPANGLRLQFDGPEQRLRLIEVLDFTKEPIFFMKHKVGVELVKFEKNGTTSTTMTATAKWPTFKHIYHTFLGPTFDGEFIPGDGGGGGSGGSSDGTYVLSYPGVALTFPMSRSVYSPAKNVMDLMSTSSDVAAISMAVFSGESWAQARDHLWTEVLPPVNSIAPLPKGKDVSPDEVSLINIHGGGKLQLFRLWDTSSTPSSGPWPDSSSSFWISLGETTPQELVAELGPPDAIYRKSDQRMYIHKIRTASSSRTRPNGLGTGDPLHHRRHYNYNRRQDDPLTDTDQSSIPTASSEDDDEEDAIDDEFLTGNVSSECFFNYFHLGFDILVSTPTAPSRSPPSKGQGAEGDGNGSESGIPDRPLMSEAPDRLVATKVVLHGNVPGSYPFNRHRRCRWSIAYLTDTDAAVNSETPFPQIEEQLHSEWKSIYSSDEEARQRQRGMVLNRGWGDSPGNSIELLGGWEEGQRRKGGRGGGEGGGGKGPEDSTTTLYGFPGLVFEVLRNGLVSALTVF